MPTSAPTDAEIERLTDAAAGRPGYPNAALREALMLRWYRLIPYTGTRESCPRRIVGKHCRSYARNCACQAGGGELGVFDHTRMWITRDTGELVMTGEPYRQTPGLAAAIDDLRRACTEIGVAVTTGDQSPYAYPLDDCELILMCKARG